MQTEVENAAVAVNAEKIDEDGFISLWNLAAGSADGSVREENEIRTRAGRLLAFLCKHRYEYILVSQHNLQYIQDRFDRDEKVLNNWTPDSESVDIVAQHVEAPGEAVVRFLKKKRFDPNENYNPRRSARLEWFNEDWKVG